MWRSLAESGHRILQKGLLICIEGKVRTRSFEDKSGIKRYTTEIVADSFTVLGRSSDFKDEPLINRNSFESKKKNDL